ncbi:MAG: hypothetical protein AAFP87_20500 [Pseudomonadota bacterium]
MVRTSPPSPSAASGELSKLMFGRSDYVRFQNGLRKCRGFMVLPEGPVTRLPGTEYLGRTHNNQPARLMRFKFTDEDALLLEWTDQLLRFWRGDTLVPTPGGDVPYTLATPYSLDQAKQLQSLLSSDRIYLTEGEIAPHRLSRFAIDNWSIEPTPFVNGPFSPRNLDESQELFVDGVTGVVQVTASFDIFEASHVGVLFELREVDTNETPYWSADIDTKTGDEFYYNSNVYRIAGFDAANGKTHTSAPTVAAPAGPVTSGGVVQWVYVSDANTGSYPNWTAGELVEIGDRRWTGAYVIEVSGFALTGRKTGINPPVHLDGLWLTEKGGAVYEYLHNGSGIIRVTGVSDARTATATVERQLPKGLINSGTYRWAEQAWSDTKGWPRAIGAYRQRHIYGGTPLEPRTIWHSVIGGTVDMSATGGDDEGFSYILDSDARENGKITYIVGTEGVLHIGTTAGEFVGSSSDADRAYAEETALYENDTNIGSADVAPVVVSGKVVFLDKTGRRMIALLLDQSGRFEGEPLTQIARHMLAPCCVKLVYQADPVPIIWGLLDTGELVGCTYILKQEVLGFHRHGLAGGQVDDIEVMPSADGSSEVLELVVKRAIGGQDHYFRERLQDPFVDLAGDTPRLEDAWHFSAAVRYQGAATDQIAGLDHLEGETVCAWTELGAFEDLVVIRGAVTLPERVVSAIVGLDGSAEEVCETLDLRIGTPDGGDEGRMKAHRATGVHVHWTAGGTFSVVQILDGEHVASDPAPIIEPRFSDRNRLVEDAVFDLPGHKGWAKQSYFRFNPEPGAPLTVMARTPTAMVSDS